MAAVGASPLCDAGLSPQDGTRRVSHNVASVVAKPSINTVGYDRMSLLRPRTYGMVAPSKVERFQIGLEDNGLKRKDSLAIPAARPIGSPQDVEVKENGRRRKRR